MPLSLILWSCLAALPQGSVAEATPQTDVAKQAAALAEKYGVKVLYQYDEEEFFPSRWRKEPISAHGTSPALKEVPRVLPVVERFLSRYPKAVLEKNLKRVCLLGELKFYGKSFGGTSSRDTIYIKCQTARRGFSDRFLRARMHSEFSSILMRNYEFPKSEWEKVNDADFKYSGNGVEVLGQGDLYGQDEQLLKKGFVVRYAMSSMENDFNMIVDWMFTRPEALEKLAKRHPRIRTKLTLTKKFYQQIDPAFTFK